jgi:NADPH:quinone reductase-like Zn-dependent oxidoreductase
MRAITFSEFGGSDVLELADVDIPTPGPGQIRLAVRAAAVNALDWKIRHGWLQPALPASLPSIPGFDAAGVVDAVGEGVTEFAIGDEVLGASLTGSYAEFALAGADKVVSKPASIDWDVAGGFNTVGRTADRVLREVGVLAGQTLLVHGASGAVGSMVVQLAVARGISVIGTAGARNQQLVTDLGATAVVYGAGLTGRVQDVGAIDKAIDIAGSGDLAALIELAGGADNVLTIADMAAEQFGVRFSAGQGPDVTDLAALVALLGEGSLTSHVHQTFPLSGAGAAQDLSESGHAGGRIVLIP